MNEDTFVFVRDHSVRLGRIQSSTTVTAVTIRLELNLNIVKTHELYIYFIISMRTRPRPSVQFSSKEITLDNLTMLGVCVAENTNEHTSNYTIMTRTFQLTLPT